MILVTKWFGVFLCEDETVRKFQLFDKDPKSVAKKLAAIQKGEILPEERSLAVRRMKVADVRMKKLGKPTVFDSSFIRPEAYGIEPGFMQKVMVELGKVRTREPLSEDKCIAQAIRAQDDIIETINLMNERMHEWYGLHFPELSDYAVDERYVELISQYGERDKVLEVLQVELESVGSEMAEEDIAIIRSVAGTLYELYQRKSDLDHYISEGMQKVAPNMTALLSANLAARLISLSGGLARLTKLPASTVQLLGAEKAMFMHLRSGKRPPKHGIIFQHPWVNRSPYWQRGKISRSLGGKISIACKVDYYKGEFIGDKLKKQMELRVDEVQKKYPNPPKRAPAPRPRWNNERKGRR